MKFVLITGPPASGKMTVGQELSSLTDFKLFHNHMSLELINQFFDFGTPAMKRLDRLIRFGFFKEVAKSDLKGFIFTLVWAFNEPEDYEYVEEIVEIFEKEGGEIFIVELKASQKTRLERNKHPNRLKHKPSKRDVEASNKRLVYHDNTYRMNSKEGELNYKNHLVIENDHITALETAKIIKDHFKFSSI